MICAVDIRKYRFVQRVQIVVTGMIKNVSKVHRIDPRFFGSNAREKIPQPVHRTNLTLFIAFIELLYCKSLSAKIIVGVTVYIIEVTSDPR